MKRLVAVVAVLASVSVFAQTDKPVVNDTARNHNFGEKPMTGTLVGPTVPIMYSQPKHIFNSMIKVRADFAPELQKSVDALK